MKSLWRLTVVVVVSAMMIGCGWNRTAKGGAAGAGIGGVLGGIIGRGTGNTAAGVLIGTAIGGAAGAAIGNYMDKQARELEKNLEGAEVERVGEGIKITMPSGILFDVDSDELRTRAKEELQEMSGVLKEYEKTNIVVIGHTDSTASEAYNQRLSEERAKSVANYLKELGVRGRRLTTVGKGESDPVADNATAVGRQQNRRVEVAIFANEKLKEAAKEWQLSMRVGK